MQIEYWGPREVRGVFLFCVYNDNDDYHNDGGSMTQDKQLSLAAQCVRLKNCQIFPDLLRWWEPCNSGEGVTRGGGQDLWRRRWWHFDGVNKISVCGGCVFYINESWRC